MKKVAPLPTKDIDSSAELFVATGIGRRASVVTYRRFPQLADALRHAVENVGLAKHPGTIIECEDQRLDSHQIADRYALLRSGTVDAAKAVSFIGDVDRIELKTVDR